MKFLKIRKYIHLSILITLSNKYLIINSGQTLWVLISQSSKCGHILGLYFQPLDPDLLSHWELNLYYFSFLFMRMTSKFIVPSLVFL